MRRIHYAVPIALALVHVLAAVACPITYKATILPSLAIGPGHSSAADASGEFQVGRSGDRAVLWNGNASPVDLHPADFNASIAEGVSGGSIVGSATGALTHAMLWHGTAGSVVDLHPPGFENSQAFDVFGESQVGMGYNDADAVDSHALLWHGSTERVVNLHPAGFTSSRAQGVSGVRQVGWGNGPSTGGNDHALVWSFTAESVVDLHPAGFTSSQANGVSGVHQVGWGNGPSTGGNDHALVWNGSAERVVDLHPAGFISSQALDVAGGTQVGFAAVPDFSRAMLWHGAAESAVNLHPYLSSLDLGFINYSVATGVNEDGAVVGYALSINRFAGTSRSWAVLWAPIPEPSQLVLSIMALASLLASRRARPRTNGSLRFSAAMISLSSLAGAAQADIFQWEYINPADPCQGKQQSTTLAPDGAGVDAVPGANLTARDLTMAYLVGADLTAADAWYTNLTDADLSQANLNNASFSFATLSDARVVQANLANADFSGATMTGVDFTGADVQGARFGRAFAYVPGGGESVCVSCSSNEIPQGTGVTLPQLYSTASFQLGDLKGIHFSYNDLAGGNFAGQNLTDASFELATLTGADFTGAVVRRANFRGAAITLEQVYSTASYQSQDVTGIDLGGNYLSGGNFAGQNLSNASFAYTTLTDANFAGATIQGSNFDATVIPSSDPFCRWSPGGCAATPVGGITLPQLYSTNSYQTKDLSGISLGRNDLAGANFVGQNFTNANFNAAALTGADFTGADVRGADFTSTAITLAQLYSTASFHAHDLNRIGLRLAQLAGADFANQNVAGANFQRATLTGANLSGADVRGANFEKGIPTIDAFFGTGISLDQLYTTASYQAHDLTGIGLIGNDLSNADFSGQNLRNADFRDAKLIHADFTGTDIRSARFGGLRTVNPGLDPGQLYSTANYQRRDLRGVWLFNLSNVDTTNVILPWARINGLDLGDGEILVVSDYERSAHVELEVFPITIDQHLTMSPGGTLRMVFEADAWDSTISFAPGIPVTLGGTLELTFADDVNLATQLGRTFDLFDWAGVTPTGAFAISSPYVWDLSNLYTTGELTLTAVPEPTFAALLPLAVVLILIPRRLSPAKNRC